MLCIELFSVKKRYVPPHLRNQSQDNLDSNNVSKSGTPSPFDLAIREHDDSKLVPNFFLSLKIMEPSLLQTIKTEQQELSKRNFEIFSLGSLHITVLRLRILALEDLQKIQNVLARCNRELSSFIIGFQGMEMFDQGSILVLPIEVGRKKLCSIRQNVELIFKQEGVQSLIYENREYLPHISIGKANNLNQTDFEHLRTTLRNKKMDSSTQMFNSIDLCSRNLSKGDDGYYCCF